MDVISPLTQDQAGNIAMKGTPLFGFGVPGVVAQGRVVGAVAAVPNVVSYTPQADGLYAIVFYVNVTTSTTFSFNTQATFTDETGTVRTTNINVTNPTGAVGANLSNASGAGQYPGLVHVFRVKGGTPITALTSAGGTYTSVVFNIEAMILRLS